MEVAGLIHGRRVDQGAVEAIGPVVIGADEAPRIAGALGHQHGAVLADRGHRLDLAAAGAGDHDRLIDDGGGEIVARRLHPVLATDAQPFVIEHRLLLEGVELRVGVAGRWQGLGLADLQHGAGEAVEEIVGQER